MDLLEKFVQYISRWKRDDLERLNEIIGRSDPTVSHGMILRAAIAVV